MTDLSTLSSITTSVTSLSNLILVSPQKTVGYQPLNPPDANGAPSTAPLPKAFIFNYEGEQSVDLDSDITDHYVENNYAIQDQVALKPEIVNTSGFIGELNDVVPPELSVLQLASQKLTTIGGYIPQLTTTALIAYQEALFLYQTGRNAVNSVLSTVESLGGLASGSSGQSVVGSDGLTAGTAQNKQQQAFQFFYGAWRNRTLFNVQTPWAVFQNMAIMKIKALQDAETRVISDFTVTFKMIRVASTITLGGPSISSSGRAQSQSAPLTNLGTSTPTQGQSITTAMGK